MPAIAVSTLTPDDMRIAAGALHVSVRALSTLLGKSRGTVSHYLTGRCRIPQSVADRLRELLLHHAGDFLTDVERSALDTAAMAARANVSRNEHELAAGHMRYSDAGFPQGRLPRRQRIDPAKARVFPPYRVREAQSLLLVAALKHWGTEAHGHYHQAATPAHQRDYQLELADIAALMTRVPQDVRGGTGHAFDMTINEVEWDVISRALRRYAPTVHPRGKVDGPAYVFYQHWRKHRFAGYPFVPAVEKAQRDELIGKLAAQ